MKHKQIGSSLILIALLMQAFVVGMTFAQSTVLSTQFIMGGVYPGAPSYTVWKENTVTYAKDTNGQIDFYSTNSSAVIEYVLDVFTRGAPGASEANGGRLLIKDGNYTSLTGNFTIPDNAVIEGEGTRTVLQMGSNDLPLFSIRGYNVRIKNFNLKGTKTAGVKSHAHGIEIYSTGLIAGAWIENNLIYGFNRTGIHIDGAPGSYQDAIFINHNDIYQNGHDGVYVGDTCWETYIQGNSINYNGNHGIELDAGGEISILGNDIYNNDDRGIYVYGGTAFDISHNEIADSAFDGILVENIATGRGTIDGNRIWNNDWHGGGTAGITLSGVNRTVVTDNILDSWGSAHQDYGIRETSGSDWNLVVGNICYGEIAGLKQLGANSIFQHNINRTAT